MMSRVECTRVINQYVRDKSLQNPDNGREILPDKSLTKLLGYKKAEHGPLYYYVVQKLIQQHFSKGE
jgi:chromatin remodeling complex protein RSC6